MNNLSRAIWFVLAVTIGTSTANPVDAQISAELAKKCRALMIAAHPTKLYARTGTEAAQRAYFQKCISRNGDMPETPQGSGSHSPSAAGNKN